MTNASTVEDLPICSRVLPVAIDQTRSRPQENLKSLTGFTAVATLLVAALRINSASCHRSFPASAVLRHLPSLCPERSDPTRPGLPRALHASEAFHTNPGTSAATHAQLPTPLAPIASAPSILGASRGSQQRCRSACA